MRGFIKHRRCHTNFDSGCPRLTGSGTNIVNGTSGDRGHSGRCLLRSPLAGRRILWIRSGWKRRGPRPPARSPTGGRPSRVQGPTSRPRPGCGLTGAQGPTLGQRHRDAPVARGRPAASSRLRPPGARGTSRLSRGWPPDHWSRVHEGAPCSLRAAQITLRIQDMFSMRLLIRDCVLPRPIRLSTAPLTNFPALRFVVAWADHLVHRLFGHSHQLGNYECRFQNSARSRRITLRHRVI